MATRKKKSNWIDDQAAELNEAFADMVFDEKTKKVKWPKVTVGSHLTVTEYQDGRTSLVWDDEALLRDVRLAILTAESKIPAAEKVKKAAVKVKTEVQKKKAAAITAKPKKVKK